MRQKQGLESDAFVYISAEAHYGVRNNFPYAFFGFGEANGAQCSSERSHYVYARFPTQNDTLSPLQVAYLT